MLYLKYLHMHCRIEVSAISSFGVNVLATVKTDTRVICGKIGGMKRSIQK